MPRLHATKLLGMPTHPERSFSLLWTLSHVNWSLLLSGVDWPLASPFANCLLRVPLSNSSRVPFLLPVTSRSRVQTLCLVSRQNRQRDRLLGGPPTQCYSKTLLNQSPGNESKQSDGEAFIFLELWVMRSSPSLPLLPGLLWHGVVAFDRVLSLGQIELFNT